MHFIDAKLGYDNDAALNLKPKLQSNDKTNVFFYMMIIVIIINKVTADM